MTPASAQQLSELRPLGDMPRTSNDVTGSPAALLPVKSGTSLLSPPHHMPHLQSFEGRYCAQRAEVSLVSFFFPKLFKTFRSASFHIIGPKDKFDSKSRAGWELSVSVTYFVVVRNPSSETFNEALLARTHTRARRTGARASITGASKEKRSSSRDCSPCRLATQPM